jgi:hypothetical protein
MPTTRSWSIASTLYRSRRDSRVDVLIGEILATWPLAGNMSMNTEGVTAYAVTLFVLRDAQVWK